MKKRERKEYTDEDLNNTLFIRRLLIREIENLQDRVDAKCDGCRNSWFIKIGAGVAVVLVVFFSAWITAVQAEFDKAAITKAVASEVIKAVGGSFISK